MRAGLLQVYRRRLPHWRQVGATYFVTWRLFRSQPDLAPVERTVVVDAIRGFAGVRYDLLAYVVMNDHVHTVVSPAATRTLASILHSWKSYSAYRLQRVHGRRGAVWQDESYDRIIRSEAELRQKLRYVLLNPRRRWSGVKTYPWLWVLGMED